MAEKEKSHVATLSRSLSKKAWSQARSKVERRRSTRYVIRDAETGKVIDDCGGNGYASARSAYAGWRWKTRKPEKVARDDAAEEWLAGNKTVSVRLKRLLKRAGWRFGSVRTADAKGVLAELAEEGELCGEVPSAYDVLRAWKRQMWAHRESRITREGEVAR